MTQVPASPRLLDRVREKLRLLRYSKRTEEAYLGCIEKFLRFGRDRNRGVWRHPSEMGKAEVEEYLTFLAVEKRVAPSTQNQAFSAILFLYRQVLQIDLPPIEAGRAQRRPRLPVVLSRAEVARVLEAVVRWCRRFAPQPLAILCYPSGIRLWGQRNFRSCVVARMPAASDCGNEEPAKKD